VERIDTLEKGLIRLEGNMGALTKEMSTVASSIVKISEAVTKLAVVDVRISDLDKSINNVADAHRSLSNRVDALDSTHSIRHGTTLEKADTSGWRRFGLAMAAMSACFGYLYIDVGAERKGHQAVLKELAVIERSIDHLESNDKVIETKLKDANGHRYYLSKESVDALQKSFEKHVTK